MYISSSIYAKVWKLLRAIVGSCALIGAAHAQIAPARTWPELKQAIQERANNQRYPLTGFDAKQVAETLGRIQSLDRDEWAQSWIQTGKQHSDAARAFERSDRSKAAEAYLAAWRYYSFGAWPTQNSNQKVRAQSLSTEAFRGYAALAQPTIEVLRIPFEGKEIVGYLQKPGSVQRPPVVISVGGLDSYKEFVAEQYGPSYLKAGLAYLAIDLPGTAESPMKAEPDAQRIFAKVIDAIEARPDLDGKNIGFQGVSWGGYWATRMAYVESDRLKAAVNWGGPVHAYFEPEWQLKALGTREYLFDLFAARAGVYRANTLDEFLSYGPRMSLKTLIANKSAPVLLVNGEQDSQVPIADLYLPLKSGTPKEAWVNPQGGHLGRSRDWPDGRILNEIVIPYLSRNLKN